MAQPEIWISGADHNHIKNVLRMRGGEKIRISTGTGRNYFAKISKITQDATQVEILEEAPDTELPCEITLYQGLPKADKLEQIIQKTTELGAARIVPVAMKNCVVRLDEKKAAKKILRWQSIAESAARQAKRSKIPEVAGLMTFPEALREAQQADRILLPYENARGMEATREVLGAMAPGEHIGVFIGPEGGFDPSEIAQLPEPVKMITLGKRILRTETAGPAVLAMIALLAES